LTPICTKSFFLLELRPRLTGGAYSAPPDPLAVFRGPTSLIKGEKGRRSVGEGERKRRGGEGRGEERRGEREIIPVLGRKKIGA